MEKQNQDNTEEDFTKEDFEKEIELIKKKGKNKYKEVTEAGNGFKNEVYNFMKIIWDKEVIPKSWDLTTLVQIFKRGNRNQLSSYRFVHLKKWMPRIFDRIVLS